MKNAFSLLLIFTFVHSPAFAQNTLGLPAIVNYKKQVYGGGTQNWGIKQDAKGFLYFANNEGLLCFDGTSWRLYPLPNKTIVRSVGLGNDNRIYVGGQDEIGYFAPSRNGKLSYTSLKNLLPEQHRTFEDLWDIVCVEDEVFFRSTAKIFHLRQNKMRVYPATTSWLFMGTVTNYVLAQNAKEGLLHWKKGAWQPLAANKNLPAGCQVTAAVPFGPDTLLLATTKHGLYLFTAGKMLSFQLNNAGTGNPPYFTTAVRIDEETFALGTYTNGCFIVDRQGRVVQNFSRKTGLQNNNVRSLFCDRSRNIWLGLDNGIDFIAFSNAVKQLNPPSFNDGAGYASAVVGNYLYLGLSDGLFQLPLSPAKDISYVSADAQPVAGAEGQIWGLSPINNQLLVSTHDGLYQLQGNQCHPLVKGTGFWTAQPLLHSTQTPVAVAGHYNGVQVLEASNSVFVPGQAVPDYRESSRFVTVDKDNTVWTSHPYRGVYKIKNVAGAPAVVKLYTDRNGLPSALNNHVYKIKNEIVVATEKGIYSYNSRKDAFESTPGYKAVFGEMSLRYLKEDPQGNIWFIHEKNLGVVDYSGPKPQILYFPELKGKMVSGFEHINPINEYNILIGAENGFYHINYEKYKQNNHKLHVDIRAVQAIGKTDSLLFGGYAGTTAEIPRMPYHSNSFYIQYSAPFFEQQPNIEYRYYLEGFDKTWSEWTKKTEKDYTNLPAGTYTFRVKARNNLGSESAVASYSFLVLPPWHQTSWAYMVYTLMAGGLAFLLYKRHQKQLLQQQQKHQQEQLHLLYLHQLELEKSEKEIVKLRNEKLETEIEFKNSELASTAMHLVKKGELLTKIKEELQRLNKNQTNEAALDHLKKLVRIISEEEKNNEDWEQFARHFNQVHSNFLLVLKEKYPTLTAHELKLCAYLRMNLSTKEIAQLMNITVRGVEISRYRLRKKLGIATEVNLFQFFLEINSQKEDGV